jgi:hypothetical protein
MNSLYKWTILPFFTLIFSGCAAEFGVPPPPSGLPYPYANAKGQPHSREEEDYLKYLRTTALLPDQRFCEKKFFKHLYGYGLPDFHITKSEWVTPTYMAWGGPLEGQAIIGPVERLYSITEAHIEFTYGRNLTGIRTVACFAKYAKFKQSNIWRAGHVLYGSYNQPGIKKYISGPDYTDEEIIAAPPGNYRDWDPVIRYYRND